MDRDSHSVDRRIWASMTDAVDRALVAFPSPGRFQVFTGRLIVLMLIRAV